MFFLPNVTTPICFFLKFHKNEKSLQPTVQCTIVHVKYLQDINYSSIKEPGCSHDLHRQIPTSTKDEATTNIEGHQIS